MPLKCLRGDEEVYAFDVEDDRAWENIRAENAKERSLRMPCCGAAVVLRTSMLGTKHFAHARRGPCTTVPETAEHLLAKRVVVEGVRRTAWAAKTEQDGSTPDGERWRADVLATRGTAKVAIEIQWSRQDGEETLRRQDRYEAAGVRGLWLFRQHDLPLFFNVLPSFRLMFDARTKSFSVALPSPAYRPQWIKAKNKGELRYWSQTVELSKFAEGSVSGRLRFAPTIGATLPLDVFATPTTCNRCKSETRVVTGLVFAASKVFPAHPDIPVSLRTLGDVFGGEKLIGQWLPPALLRRYGIGALKVRRSGLDVENRESYLSNGCVKCDALQARYFEDRLPGEAEEFVLSVDTLFEGGLALQLPNLDSYIHRWWFDERP
jgi:competence protein CoiA